MDIKIRYNTDKEKIDSSLRPWRVIVDGTEYLADNVVIKTKSWTTLDEVSPGKFKWHMSAVGHIIWNASQTECEITENTKSAP